VTGWGGRELALIHDRRRRGELRPPTWVAGPPRWSGIVESAGRDGVDLLVFPDACLGGYIGDLRAPASGRQAVGTGPGRPEIAAVIAAAGPMTVSSATPRRPTRSLQPRDLRLGDGVLGSPPQGPSTGGRRAGLPCGDAFAAFDTPVGPARHADRLRQTFPESARALALDGAQIIAALSAVAGS